MSEHSSALNEICPALGLGYADQDWAITFADPLRIDEFVSFYRSRPDLRSAAQTLLFELVIASISEALEAGASPDNFRERYAKFVREESASYPDSLSYWTSLDQQKWKIARWLKDVVGGGRGTGT